MYKIPNQAFILAAGKGTRLRPYTDTLPKPMVSVWGKPIIEHTVEKLQKIGVRKTIINLCYLGDRIKNHFQNYDNMDLIFSEEGELLDTGGGIKFALHHLAPHPFFIINGDAFWTDGNNLTIFERLAHYWNDSKMDILILLQPFSKMTVTQGVGDYNIDQNGRAIRNLNKSGTHMFGGIRIAKPQIFNEIEEKKFSFLHLMDQAEKRGTLYGLEHDGDWHHISTPEDLENVNALKGSDIV